MKNIAIASFLISAIAVGARPASADWSVQTVTQIMSSRASYLPRTIIVLNGITCPTGDFYIDDTNSNRDAQVDLVIAAMVSGHSVALGYSPVTGVGCDVYSVELK